MTRMEHEPFASTAMTADYLQYVGVLPPTPSKATIQKVLQEFDANHVPTNNQGFLDLDKLTRFAKITAPHAKEYYPHNLRIGAHLNTLRGAFGDEQYVTRYYQKPAHENDYMYRTAFEKDEDEF